MERSINRILLIIIALLTSVHYSQQQQRLLFSTNAGIGRYMFRYNETVPSQGILPPPPGFFNVSCLLNGRPAEDIFYSIIGDSDVFQVDNATGALTVMPLDYETTMSYRFSVRCTLTVNGTDLMNIAQVDFQVIPVNEFQPQLSQSSVIVIATELDSIGKVLVSTRSDVNASVVFSATDEDEGPGGMLRFSLAFNENLTAFNVDPETGTLTVAQSLDVDNSPSGFDDIEVRLTVCDVDPPVPTCPNLVIRTFIFSSNDNNPVFTENVYRVSVLESMSSGVVIATVSCTDDDVGIGRFNNVTSSSNIFNVSSSPTSQNISLASQLDYETARNHNITLTCFDTGGFTATAMLIVTVLPVNDNGPRFIEREYFFTMSRIETTGNVIGRVEAQDNDQDVGDTITYTLTEDDNFQIQGDGSIILRDFVYILEGQVFELQAVVNDGEFSDRVPVTITVNGVFSVPEIILICMGAVIFLVLALFIIVLCCYCCVCCSRLVPKQRHVDVPREVPVPVPVGDPMAMPMTVLGGDMYSQGNGPMYMIGKIPTDDDGQWGPRSGEETEEEMEAESFITQSSRVYTPTPMLKEMLDKFQEGDEMLLGKKAKRKE